MLLVESAPAQTVHLTNGDVVEVIYIGSGTEHAIDTRSYYEKLRNQLPRRLQKLAPKPSSGSTEMSMSGPDSLGIALQWKTPKSGMPATPLEEMIWILSDNSGWYDSNYGTGGYSDNHMLRPFALAARRSEKLTLSLYSQTSDSTAGALLGKIDLKSPRCDPSVRSSKSIPPPRLLKSGPLELEILNLFTGIYVDDVPTLPFISFMPSATDHMTSSILELSRGRAQKAALPQFARSALVFRHRLHGKPTGKIRNMTMVITDSKGSKHTYIKSKLYRGKDACVFLWDTNLPITDGNYRFELTVLEDPPADSPDWSAMAPVMPGKVDSKSTVALSFKGKAYRAGMTEGADRINLETYDDPSLLSIMVEQTGTSNTLAVSSFEGRRWDQRFRSTIILAEPITTGSVTLKFSKPIEHKVSFSNVPERP